MHFAKTTHFSNVPIAMLQRNITQI